MSENTPPTAATPAAQPDPTAPQPDLTAAFPDATTERPAGPFGPPPPYPPVAAPPKTRWRDRPFKLWSLLVVGVACLIVGLGAGTGLGFALDDDHDSPSRLERMPGDFGGPGFGGRGDRFGWPGRQDGQQDGQPSTPSSPGSSSSSDSSGSTQGSSGTGS